MAQQLQPAEVRAPMALQTINSRMNSAPSDFDARASLPAGFLEFVLPLHREFTPRQHRLIAARTRALAAAHAGSLPHHRAASRATIEDWTIDLPHWCQDQRNQMTGPADDAELVVKMLNSGAPGVMIDLEDSMANRWPNLMTGHRNAIAALHGTLSYGDARSGRDIAIQESKTVTFTRVRGLHLSQAGVIPEEPMAASLFDVALLVMQVDPARLKHPLCIYIPKSESAEEALWWRDLFQRLATLKGLPHDAIKCMALVESHPLAFELEEFAWHLRDHLLGLNLGRWDYMASLIHFTLPDPKWVLPDRNTIPHDVAFFQKLRELIPEICHKHRLLAIGGMTALYPSRQDRDLNARALDALRKDKKNEADALMDGAWTGHPDQNAIAVAQFPVPNQVHRRNPAVERYPDLRPIPSGVGVRTLEGTRLAARVTTLYRYGVLTGKGASLIDGYMEDLATDRIYRLMLTQRVLHSDVVEITDPAGRSVRHTPQLLTRIYDEELDRILAGLETDENRATCILARRQSEDMIANGLHDPV
jgi:malate synthase